MPRPSALVRCRGFAAVVVEQGDRGAGNPATVAAQHAEGDGLGDARGGLVVVGCAAFQLDVRLVRGGAVGDAERAQQREVGGGLFGRGGGRAAPDAARHPRGGRCRPVAVGRPRRVVCGVDGAGQRGLGAVDRGLGACVGGDDQRTDRGGQQDGRRRWATAEALETSARAPEATIALIDVLGAGDAQQASWRRRRLRASARSRAAARWRRPGQQRPRPVPRRTRPANRRRVRRKRLPSASTGGAGEAGDTEAADAAAGEWRTSRTAPQRMPGPQRRSGGPTGAGVVRRRRGDTAGGHSSG